MGKTTMMRSDFVGKDGYEYFTLADAATKQRAEADLAAWLESLALPAIIDEAQLIPELPLALKEYVDQRPAGNQFLLTGSASIGRTGLGGADPLTRRSERMTMHPLTRWELNQRSGSLLDLLFDGEPRLGSFEERSDSDLYAQLRVGGFPLYALGGTQVTSADLRRRISADLVSLLSEAIAPDLEYNVIKARVALDALLRSPGGIFNAASLGRDLELDKRTIERYVSVFGRLFLVQWLPNLAAPPRKQHFSRAKIHPVDTSLSVNALERAGVDALAHREQFGQLLESWVVCELLAASQWSQNSCAAFYWRQASSTNPEVDLVFLDERGRALAIEVKAATSVSPRDLRGIRALAATRDVHRSFVFYRGTQVLKLDERSWALPFSALGEAEVFTRQ